MPLKEISRTSKNDAPTDCDWREWIDCCDIWKCLTPVQGRLQQFAAQVGIVLQSKRRDIGFEVTDSLGRDPENFWAIFEAYIQAGHLLQSGKEIPAQTTWHGLADKTKAYKNSLGQAKRGLSAYAASIMRSAFLHFASGESQRRIRRDGKLRTLDSSPVTFFSLDAPTTDSDGATYLDTLSDFGSEVPGVADVCAGAARTPHDEKAIPEEVLALARALADEEFKKISGKKIKTVVIGIAATALGISRADHDVLAAAGVENKSSVASALLKYLQNLTASPVFNGMRPALKIQAMRIALRHLTRMSLEWATETHVFAPGNSDSPPKP